MSANPALLPHDQVSSVGVDGQHGPQFGFITEVGERAWWQVDLGSVEPIAEIVIYKYDSEGKECDFPFDVIVSPDGRRGTLTQTIAGKSDSDRWRIHLQDVTARYIRLQMRGRGRLALAEVEVYRPENNTLDSPLR